MTQGTDMCERTGWDREMAWGNAVALHGFGWRSGLPFVEDLADMAETLTQQRLHVELELARRAR